MSYLVNSFFNIFSKKNKSLTENYILKNHKEKNQMIEKLIAATYAPMHEDGTINTACIENYKEFLVRNQVAGVFMNGSTGDFTSLSDEERKLITLGWSKCKSDDLYLIDHVGHTSLKVAKDLATFASDKVDAIAAIAPYYFKLNSIDKLVYYCKEIALCAPKLPFFYYHIPVLSGANLNMEKFLEKAKDEIPNLAGIKFTNHNLIDYNHCKNLYNGRFNMFFGYDELFINSLPIGATSWVGSTYNHLAPLYHKIIELFESGQMEEATSLQIKAIKFVEFLNSKGGFNGVAKGFMKTLGIDCGPSRFPHTTLNDMDYIEINKHLESLGITAWFSK